MCDVYLCSLIFSPEKAEYELADHLKRAFITESLLGGAGFGGVTRPSNELLWEGSAVRPAAEAVVSALVGAVDRHYGLFALSHFVDHTPVSTELHLRAVEAAIRACWCIHSGSQCVGDVSCPTSLIAVSVLTRETIRVDGACSQPSVRTIIEETPITSNLRLPPSVFWQLDMLMQQLGVVAALVRSCSPFRTRSPRPLCVFVFADARTGLGKPVERVAPPRVQLCACRQREVHHITVEGCSAATGGCQQRAWRVRAQPAKPCDRQAHPRGCGPTIAPFFTG